jgi:hypothetical protein
MLAGEVIARWSALGLCMNNEMYINISWESYKIGPTSDGKIIAFQFINHLMIRRTVSSELQTASASKIYINKHSKNKSIDRGSRQERASQASPPPHLWIFRKQISEKCSKSYFKELKISKIYYSIVNTLGRSSFKRLKLKFVRKFSVSHNP